jgi:hypothetical protein
LIYLDLVRRLKREAARSGGAPGGIETLAGDDVLLGDWIADAWREIQRRRMDWAWMRKTVTGVLVQSQQAYSAETDLDFTRIAFTAGTSEYVAGESLVQGLVTATVTRVILTSGDWGTSDAAGELIIHSASAAFVAGAALGGGACTLSGPATALAPFGRWQVPTEQYTVRISLTDDPGRFWALNWCGYEEFQRRFIAATVDDGQPRWWSVSPTGDLLVAPAPDSGLYSISADYWARPTELTADNDEPDMPEQFHMLIVWRALLEVASFDAAPEVETRATRNLKIVWRDLIEDQAPRIQLTDVPLA